MRRRGVLGSIRRLQPGDHVCWAHAGGPAYYDALAAFLAEGLDRNERLAYFAPADLRAQLPSRIGDEVTDALIAEGRLVVLACEDAYTEGDALDVGALLDPWEGLVEDTLASGYAGLRAVGEAGWLLARTGSAHDVARYEFRGDLMMARLPLTAVCSYDTRILDARSLAAVRSVHPLALTSTTASDLGYTMTAQGAGVVRLDGELDLVHAGDAGALLTDAAAEIHTLDLSGLRFADVAGVRALARAAASIGAMGGTARIEGAPQTFRRTWELLRFDELATVAFD